jgi:hypothetical protein
LVQEFETMSQAQAFALGYAESQKRDASEYLFLVCVEPGTSIAHAQLAEYHAYDIVWKTAP